MSKNVDFKGRQLYSGDEYFIFENKHGFDVVNIEDVQQYLEDIGYYFQTEDDDRLRNLIYINFGIESETYLKDGEFK